MRSDWDISPDFEEKVRKAVSMPAPDPQFVDRLWKHMEAQAKQKEWEKQKQRSRWKRGFFLWIKVAGSWAGRYAGGAFSYLFAALLLALFIVGIQLLLPALTMQPAPSVATEHVVASRPTAALGTTPAPSETGETEAVFEVVREVVYLEPLTDSARETNLDYFVPRSPGDLPTFLILDQAAPHNMIYRSLAEKLAKRGSLVVMPDLPRASTNYLISQNGTALREHDENAICAIRYARLLSQEQQMKNQSVVVIAPGPSQGPNGYLGLWTALNGDQSEQLWNDYAAEHEGPGQQIECFAEGGSGQPEAFIGYEGYYFELEDITVTNPNLAEVTSIFRHTNPSNPSPLIYFVEGEYAEGPNEPEQQHVNQLVQQLQANGYEVSVVMIPGDDVFTPRVREQLLELIDEQAEKLRSLQPTANVVVPQATAPPLSTDEPFEVVRGVPYAEPLTDRATGNDLEYFLPTTQSDMPTFVILSNGAYRNYAYENFAEELAERGSLVVLPEILGNIYSDGETLAFTEKGAGAREIKEDAICAVRYARKLADDTRMKNQSIVVFGHQAGGHYGLWAALNGDRSDQLWNDYAAEHDGPEQQVKCLADGVSGLPEAYIGYDGWQHFFEDPGFKEDYPDMVELLTFSRYADPGKPGMQFYFVENESTKSSRELDFQLEQELIQKLQANGYQASLTLIRRNAFENQAFPKQVREELLKIIDEHSEELKSLQP